MIRLITGTVALSNHEGVVVDVNGVGYLIYTNHSGRSVSEGALVTFFTHLSVRETALDLYGFTDQQTLQLFELLIQVPKIGPKSALQILEQADLTTLVRAVRANDAGVLTKLAGIGKKTAERIVAGLNEKIETIELLGSNATEEYQETEALDTLIALGYPLQEAREALRGVDSALSLNEQVRAALRNL